MSFSNVYISSNCNQTPTAADINQNDVIAYASSDAVFIYDPHHGSGGKVTHTLISHTKRVNSVRWIRGDPSKVPELVSGSTDGSIIFWTLRNGKYEPSVLKDPSYEGCLSVTIVDGYYFEENTIICSAGIDKKSVRIWKKEKGSEEFTLCESVLYGKPANPSLAVGLRIGMYTKQKKLVIAIALDTSKIIIMVSDDGKKWAEGHTLSGHEDWVRGLDFTEDDNGDILLASSSQDAQIRIWRISSQNVVNDKFNISLESVVTGHEGWVYSVNWSPIGKQLLSASIDKSMIIWEVDDVSGLWLEKIRVGEVGGNTLGFYGGFFSTKGNQIIAYSYHGAFHIWTQNEMGFWDPAVTVGGHFGEITDLDWDPQGEFLLSVSADQTSRIHAPWKRSDEEATWHEIARPQVHGFDLSSLAIISRYKYASGAEEKIVRVFEAPITFADNFKRLCRISDSGDVGISSGSFVPKGASVPSLGLSNKAVFIDDNIDDTLPIDNKNPYPEESHFTAQVLAEPPTEETLLQNTLWPEVQKLYGHGYEIYSIAASPDGKFLASACKSTKAQYAAIFLWDTSNWQNTQQLISHNLTVVQMQFSPDSQNLISVSRDRTWSLFTRNSEGKYELVARPNKQTSVHTRIIWTCAWTHDSKYFATGSRDSKLVLWTKNDQKKPEPPLGKYEKATEPLEFPNQSVTAIAFAPELSQDIYLCAVGLEKGIIDVFTINNRLMFERKWHFDTSIAHHLTVKKLSFRPKLGRAGEPLEDKGVIQLASGGSDNSVRIYDLIL